MVARQPRYTKEEFAKFLCFVLDLVTVSTPDGVVCRWSVAPENWLESIEEAALKVSAE